MRDLSRYPITFDEMYAALERQARRIDQANRYGDIDSAALREAANRLKRIQFAASDTAYGRRSVK